MAQFMVIQNKKVIALMDTTNDETPTSETDGTIVPLTLSEYKLLQACRGDLEYAKGLIKDIEKVLEVK